MKSLLLSIFAATAATATMSCTNFQYNGISFNSNYDTTKFVTRELTFDAFDKIDLEGYNIVTYHIGDEVKLTCRSSEAAFAKATITVNEGKLSIKRKDTRNIDPIVIDITLPQLNNIELEGNGSFSAKELRGDKLSVEVTGGATIDIDSTICNELEVETNGAGMIDMVVNAKDKVDVETNGAGKIIMDINSEGSVSIETNGAGEVHANVKADKMSLEGNGANKSTIEVDVRELSVSANGVAKIDVIGVTDNAKIDVNGVAKCDRDKLTVRSEAK